MTRMQNGDAEFEEWQPVPASAVDNLEWRIRSDVYAKAPMTAASKSQQADNLMQLQGQFQYDPPIITPEEWIALKDFPNKEDILARMEKDREKKEQQDAATMEQSIMDVITQAQSMKGEGATDEEVQQQVSPMIQELIQATFTQGQSQGTAAAMSGTPSGSTGISAMGAMTQG